MPTPSDNIILATIVALTAAPILAALLISADMVSMLVGW
jgi:hypothetical protein